MRSSIAIFFLALAVLNADGFSTAPATSRASLMTPSSRLVSKHATTIHSNSQNSLRLQASKSSSEPSKQSKNILRVVFQKFFQRGLSRFSRLSTKMRRSFVMVCAAFVFCFGTFGGAQEAQASAPAPSQPVVEQVSRTATLFSPSVDQIVDDYVRDHMFDDDAYDPVESTYREAVDDRVQGTYPKALKEVTSSVLGQDVVKAEKAASGSSIGARIVKSIGFLQQRGLSETQAILLLTGSLVVGIPSIVFGVLIMIAAQNKRGMNRLMKKRYGDSYTVDATVTVEDDVDLPDDDDDDDDEDDDEDDEE